MPVRIVGQMTRWIAWRSHAVAAMMRQVAASDNQRYIGQGAAQRRSARSMPLIQAVSIQTIVGC